MKKIFTLCLLFAIICVKGQSQSYNMSNTAITTCSGNYYDPAGSTTNYANNSNFIQTITPATTGSAVKIVFSSFSTEADFDFLYIYNGNSATPANLIGKYSGTNSPGTITSTASDGSLTFRFTSDGATTRAGWAATFSCAPLTVVQTVSINSTALSTCSATYYDPNGVTNYDNNTDITQTITPSTAGAKLQAAFSSFSTEATYDFLYIYNGNSTSAALIGKYSGTTSPGTVISTATDGSLTFRFTSDAGTVSTGWVANLSCIVPALTYKSQLVSMNLGSTTWCAGETRNVTVQIKNVGTATWTDGAGGTPDINVGVKWNTNGTSWTDYHIRTDAGGLSPGATGIYTLPITASNNVNGTYSTPLTAGTNNLTFDVVYEGVSWFGDNGTANGVTVGPGNTKFASSAQTIVAPPSITTQPVNKAACIGSATSFTVAATGTSLSYQWQLSTDNGVTWNNVSNTGVYTNATTGTLNISNATGLSGYQYRVVITSSGACSTTSGAALLTVNPLPTASISYTSSPYCSNGGTATVTQTGTTGGTYSSTAGLSITPSTGVINLSASTPGTYTVTYSFTNGTCPNTTTASITITALPVATFSYASSPYCQNASNPSPTFSGGGAAGTFSSTSGLVFISTSTGQINLGASTAGTYTVTNTRAAASGCSQVTATSTVTISVAPSATISYSGSPYCKSLTSAVVIRNGTAGGTYSASPAGLSIDAGSGAVNPSASTAGTYTVSYTVAASGGCSVYMTTTSVTITAVPVATFSYPGTPYCKNAVNPSPAYSGGGAAGVFSATPAGLSFVSVSTGQVNLTGSTPGTYTVTNTRSAANGCSQVSAQSTIIITALPSAIIFYAGSPFCKTITSVTVTRNGTAGGAYSALPAGLTINASNGTINPSTSTAGDYTVTYTVAASGGCSVYTTTASVTISASPASVSISPVDPFICAGDTRQLTATGGVQTGTSVTETFNSIPQGWTTVNNSSGFLSDVAAAKWTLRPNAYLYNDFLGDDYVFRSNDNSSFYLSNSDAQGPAFFETPVTNTTLTSPAINTNGYQSLSISFYHNFITGFNSNDLAEVQVSTDGITFTTVKSYNTDQGTETYNSTIDAYEEGFVQATVNLNAYINKPTLSIRFKYTANFGFWWAIDNVTIAGGNTQLPITWSPVTNLYTNAAATTPYTAGTAVTTVYAKPGATTTYSAIATNTSGCTASSSSVVTVNQKPTASITPVSGSACEGTAIQVSITGTAGSSISYKLNGSTQTSQPLPYTFNSPSNAGTYIYDLQSVTANSCTGTISNPTSTVTINSFPTVAAIGGSNYVQTATTTQLTNTTTGGVWASNAATVASIGSTSGIISGVSEGLANITYTVTNNSCATTKSQSVRVYNPDYITQTNGSFSNAATWQIDRDDNTYATSVPVPAGTNYTSIRVQHALTLNQDFQVNTGRSFSLITGGTMDIASGKTFSSLGTVDFGGRLVTVKSDASGTGAIGQMASAIANAGNVQVERFIGSSAFATGKRAWRLLTAPVTGVTINNAWQEGAVSTSNPPAYANTTYGTLITGYVQGTAANAFSHGFDFWDAIANSNSSIRRYNVTTNQWDTMTSITGKTLESEPAYMLYVRGNRSQLNTGFSLATLRAKGTLKQGTFSTTVLPGSNVYTLGGNPFASPIDFEQIYSASTGIKPQFTIWNSQNGTYGAYTLIQRNGTNNYTIIPNVFNGGTGSPSGTAQYIVSGQGFFVQSSTSSSGTLLIGEAAKTSSASVGINPYRILPDTDKKLYVNLNLKDSDTSATLADGFLARFDASYSGELNSDDAVKLTNFNENLGIVKGDSNVIVATRPDVRKTDTLYMKLWNTTKRSYQFQVKADNFRDAPGVRAWLEDSYLGSKQELSLAGSVTTINFSVSSDSGSWNPDRFRIVFDNSSALPVTITRVTAQPKNGGAEVSWTVAGEVNIKGYTVEKSTDGGRTYAGVAGTQQAAHNNPQAALTSYSGYDAAPQAGDNLYRIRIEGRDGSVSYSEIVKVTIGLNGTGIQITLYPNPVREGKANLLLTNLAAGTYLAGVYTGSGQTVYQRKVSITQGGTTQTEVLLLGNRLAQGAYQIRVADHTGKILFTDKLVVAR